MNQTNHFKSQLLERVGMTWDELNAKYDAQVVEAGTNTKHRIVRKKQARYPDQDFLVFEDLNLFCARGSNGTLVTAMYLDGRWGYKNRAYNAAEHYGK